MSLAAAITAATSALSALLYKSGQRQVPTLTVSGESWSNSGSTFSVMYEGASAIQQGQFDYQAPAGFAFNLWMLPTQTLNSGDRIVVAADSMTFQAVEASPVGAPGPLKMVRCKLVTI